MSRLLISVRSLLFFVRRLVFSVRSLLILVRRLVISVRSLLTGDRPLERHAETVHAQRLPYV